MENSKMLEPLFLEMRKHTKAMVGLTDAINGIVSVMLSERNAPEDAEVEDTKQEKPRYLSQDDN